MRQPESAHRKTQTPIVAKQVEIERGKPFATLNFAEFASLPNSKKLSAAKKGTPLPWRELPRSKIFNLFGKISISHFLQFVNIFQLFFLSNCVKNDIIQAKEAVFLLKKKENMVGNVNIYAVGNPLNLS